MDEIREIIYKQQILDAITDMIQIIETADRISSGTDPYTLTKWIWFKPTISVKSLDGLREVKDKLEVLWRS